MKMKYLPSLLPVVICTLAILAGCREEADDLHGEVQADAASPVCVSQSSVSDTDSSHPVDIPFVLERLPNDDEIVRIADYIPDIHVELRYATSDNFTGEVIYDFSDAYLRYGTIKKLAEGQRELADNGLSLKIWDAFRPTSAQFRLWEICPDPKFVSNPHNGFSSHSRGNTVDVTLVTTDGADIVMPTGFDDFSDMADRDYSDCPDEAAENARMLEDIMSEHGFKPYSGEWWHFSDNDVYDVAESFIPSSDGE